MSQIVKRMRGLSPVERGLALEATLALAAAAIAIAVLPFRTIAAIAARRIDVLVAEGGHAQHVAQVRWAVTACARSVPWRAKCFEQALAAQWMLSRRRIPSILHYGAAKSDTGGLVAHVWLKSGQLDVVGCEIQNEFTELARFPG